VTTQPQHPGPGQGRDAGFTLIEMTMVMVILGIVMSTLAMAIVVALRTSPGAEERLDDSRATRALATWLSHDTMSTPPFLPEKAQGGINIDRTATADNNDCGGNGTNLLHLQWIQTTSVNETFVTNYRFTTDGDSGEIKRYSCFLLNTGMFSRPTVQTLTSGLDPTKVPEVTAAQLPSQNVTSITFALIGRSGERVAVQTGSRNLVEFFP